MCKAGCAAGGAQGSFSVMQVGRPCSPTRPLRGVVGCLFVSHLCTLCNLATVLSSVHAYTQRAAGMHALCRASHPSRGERASRLRDSAARCRVVARRVPTVARAELGLGLDPDNDLRCFGYARPHIFHVVHSVLHTGIAKNRPLTRAPLYVYARTTCMVRGRGGRARTARTR